MRLTHRKLISLINSAFEQKREHHLKAIEAYKPDNVLKGAAPILVKINNSDYPGAYFTMRCYSSLNKLNKNLRNGAVIGFKMDGPYWSDAEIVAIL